MTDNVMSPDKVAAWMECSRRTATKLIRQVASHWTIPVTRNGRGIVEPRVLESELLRYLKEPRNRKAVSRMTLPGKKIKLDFPKTMKQIYEERFSKSETSQ